MDDYEAEVDLVVNDYILLTNTDKEVIETEAEDTTTNQDEGRDIEEDGSIISPTNNVNIEGQTLDVSKEEGNGAEVTDEVIDIVTGINVPAEQEADVGTDPLSNEDEPLNIDNEEKVLVINGNSSFESGEAVETVIDVSSVSRDHISPVPNLTVNTHDSNITTQTESFESENNPNQSEETVIGSGGIIHEAGLQNLGNNERPVSSSLGKVIVTSIQTDGGEKTLSVNIVDATYKKPFLGGFRHKHTGVEYLNASCQTYPKKIIPKTVEVFSRNTQTVQKKSQMQQTNNNTSTQMTKPGCYVSNKADVIRVPGKYVTAAEKENIKLDKIIIIQSYWRRWLATQYVKMLKMDKNNQIEWELKESQRIAAEKAERLRHEFERRMKPKTKADFDLLYAALERWRQEEMDRINNSHSGPERKAALIALLEQEAYLIQSIERHRLNADEENYSQNVVKFLNKAAEPKCWRAYDGRKTEMNTKYSLRAQELRDLYNTLQMKYLNHDERLDILLTLKHTVKEHDCKLTQEMIELIDREADLLTRNVKSSNLEGLRQRILTLFLQYCKTPSFNPDVARLLKIPQESSTLRKDVYFCPSCNSYLPSTEFPLVSNSRIVGRCKKCSKLDNNARLRHDFTKIRSILQHLRRTEEDHNDGSKIAFIIQDADLSYLIEKIWNSQSALSGLDDLYDLVFVRWNKHDHWSPWNCVLLTKEEASAHLKLENISEAYGRIFVGKVHHRHVVAKQYFSKLTKISNDMAKGNIKKSKMSTQKNIMTAVE